LFEIGEHRVAQKEKLYFSHQKEFEQGCHVAMQKKEK
jgi:hypothetical protein